MLASFVISLKIDRDLALPGLGGEALHGLLFEVLRSHDAGLAGSLHREVDKPYSLSGVLTECPKREVRLHIGAEGRVEFRLGLLADDIIEHSLAAFGALAMSGTPVRFGNASSYVEGIAFQAGTYPLVRSVDRRHGRGDRLGGAVVPQCQGGPGAVGRALLEVGGDGALECRHLVSDLAAAAVLAHLLRGIAAMMARGGRAQELGEALRPQAHQMFHWGPRVRDGTLAHASVASAMRPVRHAVERRLEAGPTGGVPKTAGTCREILKRRQAWWTFVRHDGAEPTTNAAERAIRPGVLWRKGRFGTQSAEGSRVAEAMMTGVATLKPQHRHVLDDLTAACEAALRGEPAPSLWPFPTALATFMRPSA